MLSLRTILAQMGDSDSYSQEEHRGEKLLSTVRCPCCSGAVLTAAGSVCLPSSVSHNTETLTLHLRKCPNCLRDGRMEVAQSSGIILALEIILTCIQSHLCHQPTGSCGVTQPLWVWVCMFVMTVKLSNHWKTIGRALPSACGSTTQRLARLRTDGATRTQGSMRQSTGRHT